MKLYHGTNRVLSKVRDGLFTAPCVETAEIYARDSVKGNRAGKIYEIFLSDNVTIATGSLVVHLLDNEFPLLKTDTSYLFEFLDLSTVRRTLKKDFDVVIFQDHAPGSSHHIPIIHTTYLILNKKAIEKVEFSHEVRGRLAYGELWKYQGVLV